MGIGGTDWKEFPPDAPGKPLHESDLINSFLSCCEAEYSEWRFAELRDIKSVEDDGDDIEISETNE